MKKLLVLFIGLLLTAGTTFAQYQQDSNLCVGNYFTEAEGAAFLAKLKKQYQTKEAWLNRTEIIKQGILEGAGLVPFPEKTPLKPVYTNRTKI